MLQVDIRHGTPEDAALIADMIRNMVVEMAFYGGHAASGAPETWSAVTELVRDYAARPEHVYLIASHASPGGVPAGMLEQAAVGMAAAGIEPLDRVFAEQTRLHISAVYIVPGARRQGVATQLIEKVLEWGQSRDAVEVDLNVLAANPARRLYEHLGFETHEISMVKKLSRDEIVGP